MKSACRHRLTARSGTFSRCTRKGHAEDMAAARLTIMSIRAVPVMAPMTYVLGTSAGAVRAAPLLLLDLETEEGITARAYQFCYVPAAARALMIMLEDMLESVRGESVAPADLWSRLARRYT